MSFLANILVSSLFMSLKIWPKTFDFNEKYRFCRGFVIQDLEKMNHGYVRQGGNKGKDAAEVGWSPIQKSGISKYSRKKSMLQISSVNAFPMVSR